MNIFKWLTSKAGKMPVTLAQAAGLTAVVGAAGFAALSYLGGSSDNNNTFVPPSAYEQGDVVYVAQGPGSYEDNGSAGSTFRAAPSRAIQLANRQDQQLREAQELENFTAKPTFEDPALSPAGAGGKAHGLSSGEKGLGMGSNKEIGNSFEILKNMPDQFTGLGDVIDQAQAAQAAGNAGNAAPGAAGNGPTTRAPGAEGSGPNRKPATLGSVSPSWGKGGNGSSGSGGGSGFNNSFVVQDSGKNKGGANAGSSDPALAPGDAIKQAGALMTRATEGETLTSRSKFGPSDGLSGDRNALVRRHRRLNTKGANELSTIRKHTALLSKNNTNWANASAVPFLAGGTVPAGIVVTEDNVVIGQEDSHSDDISGKTPSPGQMAGVSDYLDTLDDNFTTEEEARDNLKDWLVSMTLVSLAATLAVAVLVASAKAASGPWVWILYALAGLLTAVTLCYIWIGSARHFKEYAAACGGGDGWTTGMWILSSVFTVGLAAAWFAGFKVAGLGIKAGMAAIFGIFGLYSPAQGLFSEAKALKELKNKGETPTEEETDPEHTTADEDQ